MYTQNTDFISQQVYLMKWLMSVCVIVKGCMNILVFHHQLQLSHKCRSQTNSKLQWCTSAMHLKVKTFSLRQKEKAT